MHLLLPCRCCTADALWVGYRRSGTIFVAPQNCRRLDGEVMLLMMQIILLSLHTPYPIHYLASALSPCHLFIQFFIPFISLGKPCLLVHAVPIITVPLSFSLFVRICLGQSHPVYYYIDHLHNDVSKRCLLCNCW